MKSVVPAAVIGMLWAVMACAAPDQAGLWRTIDDETGKERSLIRVTEINGELQGVVEKIFERPGDDPAHLCKKCEGDRKGKPVIGMTIMWGLKKKNDIEYTNGQILDPDNGKTYRCKLKLIEQGKKLEVRGYIGISLIGRSQVWLKEE